MDYKSAIELIVAVESVFDVNALRYRNIAVWPLVRQAIWQLSCHPNMRLEAPKPSHAIQRRHASQSVKKALRFLRNILKELKKKVIYRNSIFSFKNNISADILLFSRLADYTDEMQGSFFNRHIDSLIPIIQSIDQHSYLKLEILLEDTKKTLPRYSKTLFLDDFIAIGDSNEDVSIPGLKDLQDFLLKEYSLRLDENYIIQQAQKIYSLKQSFIRVLLFIKPKLTFLVCYYYLEAMALISACKELDISTIDIQHGKQGKYHGMYTHWTKIPSEGYELLPNYFWTWGEESKENIAKWQPLGCQYHHPIVGGNCWLGEWLDQKSPFGKTPSRDLQIYHKKYTKFVLLTLQPLQLLAEVFPKHLIEAMRQSPKSWLWLIRLHPHQKSSLRQIENFLIGCGLSNFELRKVTNLPLYELLKQSHHHVTCWSSVCYEALLFNVPTTIIHPTGLQLYAEYIAQGKFQYAFDAKTLVVSLSKECAQNTLNEEKPYIETNLSLAQRAIKDLLSIHH